MHVARLLTAPCRTPSRMRLPSTPVINHSSRALVTMVCMAVTGSTALSQGTSVSAPRTTPRISPPVGTLGPVAAAALGDPWTSTAPRQAPHPVAHDGALTTGRSGVVPLRVLDAPFATRGGGAVVVYAPDVNARVVPPPTQWYPTMQPPRWRVVDEAHPVQAWRVVDVDDVVCNAMGACTTVTSRLLARWAPRLRRYAFADRVGRVWIVE